MRTIRHVLAAAIVASFAFPAPARAGEGDIFITNQASGLDLVLNLEQACATDPVHLTFLDSPNASRRTTVVDLTGPSQQQTIHPGETAILYLSRFRSGTALSCRMLQLRAGGQELGTARFCVVMEAGRAKGEVEACPAAGSRADFSRIDTDTLAFWGLEVQDPGSQVASR